MIFSWFSPVSTKSWVPPDTFSNGEKNDRSLVQEAATLLVDESSSLQLSVTNAEMGRAHERKLISETLGRRIVYGLRRRSRSRSRRRL
jgi:hypothetical protein